MRGGINAPRQSGDDREFHLAKIIGQLPCKLTCTSRCVARTNDGNGHAIEQTQITLHTQDGRCIVQMRQQRRIFRIANEYVTPAKSLNNLQFAGDRRFVGKQRRAAPTTTNEVRQSLQRSLCATKAANELAITDRTNIRGSNEPKLIKLFLAAPDISGQLLLLPIRGSVPSIRFSIFVRCFQNTINVHATNRATKSYRPK